MNNEIKEILNEMKDICNVWVKVGGDMKSYNQDQMHCIYDYITNLQQENERLKLNHKQLKDILDFKENADYKKLSCDELAILRDYITNLQQENERLKRKLTIKKLFKKHKVQTPENFEIRKIFELQRRIEKAVNILNGRSDE